jgi:hypothetical protein
VVRSPAPWELAGVGFHQGTVDVDAHQLLVPPDPDLPATEGVGHGVEGSLEADVAVRVDGMLGPVRRVEALALEGGETAAFHVLEDGQRPLASGAMDAGAGGLQAPAEPWLDLFEPEAPVSVMLTPSHASRRLVVPAVPAVLIWRDGTLIDILVGDGRSSELARYLEVLET